MNKNALFLPLAVGLALALSVALWIHYFLTFEVAPRVAGQDNRPQPEEISGDARPLEGTLTTFDGTPSDLPGRWPEFRGPGRDAVIETNVPLSQNFTGGGPEKLWQVTLGEGYAAPAILNGRVYLIDYDMENERDAIRCFSLDDGAEIWRYSYPVRIKRNHGMSRTVPAVTDDTIVTIGPKCHVTCLDVKTGELKWMIDLVREYGTKEPLWYAGQCPLIVDGKVILAPAGPDVLMMAVDCDTGEIIWQTPNPDGWEMTHCSILPVTFGGKKMYIYPGSRGVVAVSAEDGSVIWKTDQWYLRVNVPTPVDCGNGKLFFSAGYNKGSMMMQMVQNGEAIEPKILYELPPEEFGSDQQTPIFYKGHIYGVRPDEQMVCLDTDGTVLWSSGPENKYGLGPYIIVNNILYVVDDDGWLSLITATSEKFELLAKTKVLEGHEAWGPPAYAAGRLLVRDLTTMVCLDVTKN